MTTTTLFVLITLPAGAAPAQPQPEPAAPEVRMKDVEPVWLVYRDFTGPYWRVGPLLQEVRSYMTRHGLSGPMFIRFAGNPADPETARQPLQVGFIAPRGHTPVGSFRRTLQNGGRVAYLVVENQPSLTRREYTALFERLEAEQRTPIGPVMEIYRPAPEDAAASFHTEIQIMLEPRADAVPPARPAVPDTGMPSSPPERADVSPEKPEARTPAGGRTAPPRPIVRDTQDAAAPREEPEDGSGPVITAAPGVAREGDSDARKPVPSVTRGETLPEVPPPAADMAVDSGTAAATETATGADAEHPEPVRTVRELVADGRFDRVAAQIMPESLELSPSMQIWFGQVIFRLGAVAKAIDRLNPDGDTVVSSLAEALRQRYRKFSRTFQHDPLSQSVVRVDVHAEGDRAQRQQRIMGEVDRLLSVLAVGAIDSGPAQERVLDLLQALQDMIQEIAGERQ